MNGCRSTIYPFLLLLIGWARLGAQPILSDVPGLIPNPVAYRAQAGAYALPGQLTIDPDRRLSAETVATYRQLLRQAMRKSGQTASAKRSGVVRLRIDPAAVRQREGYRLVVAPNTLMLTGHDDAGVFYGLQTLVQLIEQSAAAGYRIPACTVDDYPRFAYRGMHLDVSRHLFPVTFIKKYIDLLALYKINTFHWHLTDDQGWRIEIKGLPLLQEKAAYRTETMIGHKKELPHRFDGKRYGGYYSQAEVRDIVRYATQRHVTVIPEIEMPGHALAALSAYPELGCQKPDGAPGGPYKAATFWGIFDDVYCAGNEETFTFLERVLDEVIPLFPSKYIHIGGDECPKTRWKGCPRCQARIKAEHLADEHELQRYFIRRMERYLNGKGRQIIGWDEILEGGGLASANPALQLSPGATVMSWQGIKGGIEAMRQQHNAIMTPESHVYFDYYQSLYPEEPLTAAGYTPLSKTYSYEPLPADVAPADASYLRGVQGNAWSEYMDSPEKAEYMIVPRALAVAEIAWSQPNKRNYPDFLRRLRQQEPMLKRRDVHYANRFDEITDSVTVDASGRVTLRLSTTLPGAVIRYTTSGQEPTDKSPVYAEPLPIRQSGTVKASVFAEGRQRGRVFQKAFTISKATGKSVTFLTEPKGGYRPASPLVAVNGVAGTPRYNTGEWIGFQGSNAELVVDLQTAQMVSDIGTHVLVYHWQRMWAPTVLRVAVSEDGKTYRDVYEQTRFPVNGINPVEARFSPVRARYVRIQATNQGVISAGEYGAGANAWLLLDEIRVE